MLDTELWFAGLVVFAGAVVYALRAWTSGQGTAYVKPDDYSGNADSTVAQIEAELENLMRRVKRKVKREWEQQNARDG